MKKITIGMIIFAITMINFAVVMIIFTIETFNFAIRCRRGNVSKCELYIRLFPI
jgi:hypothetical protein